MRPEVLSPLKLIREAIALIGAVNPLPIYIWLGLSAVLAGLAVGAGAGGLHIGSPSLSGGYLAYQLAVMVVSSPTQALVLRLLLQGRENWLRLDRPLFECAGLFALAQLVLVAITLLMVPAGQQDSVVIPRRSLGTVLYLAYFYVAAKLVLWPVGRLDGRIDMGPARAWPLMRRTVRSLFAVYLLLGIPSAVAASVGVGLLRLNFQDPQPGYLVAATFLATGLSFVGQGAVVAIYRRRTGFSSALGNVFD